MPNAMARTAPFVVGLVLGGILVAAAAARRKGKKEGATAKAKPLPTVAAIPRGAHKIVHFVRHAEATHNEAALTEGRSAYLNPKHLDARLTTRGREQCAKLRPQGTALAGEIQLVAVSPLTRALETAQLSLERVGGVPWVAIECLRERAGAHPCDKRRPLSQLRHAFPGIDFSEMEALGEEDAYWDCLGEKNRETNEAVVVRAQALFEWLAARPEDNIAVVTHSAFLDVLFNHALVCPAPLQVWFENAEMRSVILAL